MNIKKLKLQGKVVFEKAQLQADFRRIPKIFQENEACFLFLNRGAFQFRTPEHVLHFTAGEAMLSKCGNYYIEHSENDQQDSLNVIAAYFYPEMVKHFFETDLHLPNVVQNFDTKKVSVQPLLHHFIESISYLLDHPELVTDDLLTNKLKELLLLLCQSESAESISRFIQALFTPYTYSFYDIVERNLYTNLSINEFAQLCNCSVATFKRRFLEVFNESPARYITRKKLEKSLKLLEAPTLRIIDISSECGFDTVSGFTKAFKKAYNQTPSRFRLS